MDEAEKKEGTEIGDEYYCKTCGNKVRVLRAGYGTLVCSGAPMVKTN